MAIPSATQLYYDPIFLNHHTGDHPESPERLRQTVQHLTEAGLTDRCQRATWAPATLEQLSRVHRPDYLEALCDFADSGGGNIEPDTVLSPKSFQVALTASGAACDAVSRIVKSETSNALVLPRPPGHHARPDAAMGFCLINHAAVAAAAALTEHQIDRVLVVDWDVHHGNGTQDIFWESEQVAFLSIHRWPFYPGTGSRDETGSGRGLGTTCNVPLPQETPRQEYLEHFTAALERLAAQHRPQLVILSAGFDAHRSDPVGSLGLETDDFQTLTERVVDIAAVHAESRIVSILEGGYNPTALGESVAVHLRTLLQNEGAAK